MSKNNTLGNDLPYTYRLCLAMTHHRQHQRRLPVSAQFIGAILNSLTAHIAVLDETGTIIAVNQAWRDFAIDNPPTTSSLAEGANYLTVCDTATGIWSEEAAPFAAGIRAVLAGSCEEFSLEYPCHSPYEERWFIGRITRLRGAVAPYAVVSHENITERKKAEQALQSNQRFIQHIANTMPDLLYIYDLRKQENIYINSEVGPTLGYTFEQIQALKSHIIASLIHPEDMAHMVQTQSAYFARAQDGDILRSVVRLRHAAGEWRWFDIRETIFARADEGTPTQILGVARDITEQKAHTEQIKHLVFTDPLTGLPNRRRLYEVGEALLELATHHNTRVGLLYLDLDRFKAFNDSLGHDAGDELLVQVAHRLSHQIGKSSLLVRLGGDEFVVLLHPTNTSQAIAAAQNILAQLCKPFEVRGHRVHLAASIGIALGPEAGLSFSRLLTQADIAMYRAKRAGRGVQVHDPTLNPVPQNRLELEAELRYALETDALTLHYQPILNLQTRQVALV